MHPIVFVRDLLALKATRLEPIINAGRTALAEGSVEDVKALLQVALTNELNVSELAAAWIPTTPEIDVKIAFARQAGDEAGHFQLVADRLAALGFDVAAYRPPGASPLFEYMTALPSTVERIAAGLFTLEALAYGVNENFIAYCAHVGDHETVRIYREYIQPDERAHEQLGQRLLEKYAISEAQQRAAVEAVTRVIELSVVARTQLAARVGTARVPGC